MNKLTRIAPVILILISSCKPAQKTSNANAESIGKDSMNITTVKKEAFLFNLMKKHPVLFDTILSGLKDNRVQIIYTQIDRGRNKMPKFTDYSFNLNSEEYFYPASTIKFPIAVLALQKLNELNIPGLDMNSTMITEADYEGHTVVYNDPTAPDGRPSIANYIKKILLVSDNDASNRLYEFLGQEYINNELHEMGYEDVQIIHRLDISMTEDQNRHTNPVKLFDNNGKVVYEKPSGHSQLIYANRNTLMGKGFYRAGQLVNEPFDFSKKNRLSLQSLHSIVRSIMFPEMVSAKQRFNLSKEDYGFLRRYMSMMPQESAFPAYDSVNYWDNYVKFLFYGTEKSRAEPRIRIFNKVGDAYGFLIDAAYVADFENNIEFMLSAVIHCNSDGIFNDDHYDYEMVGFPFMKNLGRVVYEHELKRKRNHIPDLSTFRIDYNH
jgi:hypothetical protein